MYYTDNGEGKVVKIEPSSNDPTQVNKQQQSIGCTRQSSIESLPKPTYQPPSCVSWSKEEVQSWLDDNNLEDVKIQISSYCDGRHLYQMYRQLQRSPTFFETGLRNDLHLDFHAIIKFLTALEELFSH